MTESHLPIMPTTKVAALLDHFPQLEDVLIGMAPPFRKLKNPVLRKSVAKVASLRQAAAVGRVPVVELVNKLRAAVGQEPLAAEDLGDTVSYFAEQPDWFDRTKIVESIDERVSGDEDKMPLAAVTQKASRLRQGQILELITTFLPAPGIDIMKERGYRCWSEQEEPELIRTYFSKPAGQ